MHTRAKLAKKNVISGIKKENLLLIVSHVQPALEEAENVAIMFSSNFEKNKLKNETKELKTHDIIFLSFDHAKIY